MKSFFALLVLATYLGANSDVCKIQWILSDGVKQTPSSSMKNITLIDFDSDDRRRVALEQELADLRKTREQSADASAYNAGLDSLSAHNVDGYATEENANRVKAKKFHGADGIKLKTKNDSTLYVFDKYINLDDGRFGISYKSQDGTVLDRLQDGTTLIKQDGDEILKAKCPAIKVQ